MRGTRVSLAFGAAFLAFAVLASAQEGHPLKGTWIGDWGPSADHRNQVTIVMDLDGDEVTGVVNPGPGSIRFSSAHIEVEASDRNDAAVRYTIDSTLEDIGLPDRRLTGIWLHGVVTGDFAITRQ